MTDLKIFNEEAAGRYLGGEDSPISVRTLQRWRLDGGNGPKHLCIGEGRLIRYRQVDLDEYLNSCAHEQQTQPITQEG